MNPFRFSFSPGNLKLEIPSSNYHSDIGNVYKFDESLL